MPLSSPALKRYVGLLLLAGAAGLFSAHAAPRLVKDINPQPYLAQLGVSSMLEAKGRVFFRGSTEDSGRELWVTDGTTRGTRMIKDVIPGTEGSEARPLAEMGGRVYFTSSGPWLDSLWRTNGKAAGTTQVKKLPDGFAGISSATATTSKLWFTAVTIDELMETNPPWPTPSLWVSDGSDAGTFELNPKIAGSGERAFKADSVAQATLHEDLFFSANHTQVWRSDGTPGGTVRIADLSGNGEGRIVALAATPGRWFAIFRDGEGNSRLWSGTGLAGIAEPIGDLGPHDSSTLHVAGDKVFLPQRSLTEGAGKLWRSDGTSAGTFPVGDFVHGGMVVAGDTLYFPGSAGDSAEQLWKSDGTLAGTEMVKDFQAGGAGFYIEPKIAAGKGVYFTTWDHANTNELWYSDGSTAGTYKVSVEGSGPPAAHYDNFARTKGRIVFGVSHGDPWGLWATVPGARSAKRISRPERVSQWAFGPYGVEAQAVGGKLFFSAFDGVHGWELWASEGRAQSARLVADLGGTGGNGSNPRALTPHANGVLFFIWEDDGSESLYFSDGSAQGTRKLLNFDLNSWGSRVAWIFKHGTSSYVVVPDGTGQRLWQTDGTVAGTRPVAAAAGHSIRTGFPVGNRVFLLTDKGEPNADLQILENGALSFGANLPVPALVHAVGNRMVFFAYEGGETATLWTSDGTEQGTVPVIAGLEWLTWSGSLGGVHLFFAGAGDSGPGLWRSDGTAAGTFRLADVQPLYDDLDYGPPVEVGGLLYFRADDGIQGLRLWRTDGTAQGTMVATDPDVIPGYYGGKMMAAGDRLYFVASELGKESQIWSTNGSPAGAAPVTRPGKLWRSAANAWLLPAVDGRLFFAGHARGKGLELHVLDLPRR